MKFELLSPLKHVMTTQLFGRNEVSFYKDLGLLGHNGIDFKAKIGCNVHASHSGKVTWAGMDGQGGVCITIMYSPDTYITIYYHLKKTLVRAGDIVKAGDLIALSGNTGKYTTGPHLHFGLKEVVNGATINKKNGFNGAIDPALFLVKNWDKSRAYHRYGRRQNKLVDFWFRFAPIKVVNRWTEGGRWVHRQLKKKNLSQLKTEQVNAILYGGWDFESVINPGVRQNYAYITKDEFKKGVIPFA